MKDFKPKLCLRESEFLPNARLVILVSLLFIVQTKQEVTLAMGGACELEGARGIIGNKKKDGSTNLLNLHLSLGVLISFEISSNFFLKLI